MYVLTILWTVLYTVQLCPYCQQHYRIDSTLLATDGKEAYYVSFGIKWWSQGKNCTTKYRKNTRLKKTTLVCSCETDGSTSTQQALYWEMLGFGQTGMAQLWRNDTDRDFSGKRSRQRPLSDKTGIGVCGPVHPHGCRSNPRSRLLITAMNSITFYFDMKY